MSTIKLLKVKPTKGGHEIFSRAQNLVHDIQRASIGNEVIKIDKREFKPIAKTLVDIGYDMGRADSFPVAKGMFVNGILVGAGVTYLATAVIREINRRSTRKQLDKMIEELDDIFHKEDSDA